MRRERTAVIPSSAARVVVLVVAVAAMAIGLTLSGCSGGKSTTQAATDQTMSTQTVAIAVGGPDKMSVHLDRTKGDQVKFSNASADSIEIVFMRGGPTLQIAPHQISRAVAWSEFGRRGSFPYHVRWIGAGAMAAQQAAGDTSGGPGDPDVDVGP